MANLYEVIFTVHNERVSVQFERENNAIVLAKVFDDSPWIENPEVFDLFPEGKTEEPKKIWTEDE